MSESKKPAEGAQAAAASTFTVKIFVADTDEILTVTEGIVRTHGTVEHASNLPAQEKQLYDLMRTLDIDAAHVAYDSATEEARRAAFIFGTFYLNARAFKKP